MAPIVVKDELTGVSSKRKDGPPDSKENLWASILGEVQARASTKLPSCKSVLVLGDNESGKTTLIAKLQGVEDPKKGSGLEYGYIDVRDEYRDDHTRLSVWVLDGDPAHSHLLKFALSEETYPHTLVMFTVAMTTPWGILDQLQSWASVLQDHLDRLNLSADTVQEHKQTYARKWQDYVEPGDELEPGSPLRRTSWNLDDLDPVIDGDQNGLIDGLPLGQGVLTRNLGLDVVVVVTKTDYMATLEKDYDFRDEHFDFIQQWVRRFCLQYGAALFYTSVKEDKNCDLLYKYLMHRIYGFPFRTPALVVEKDAVLIPAGWDNMKKISILYENMQSMRPDDYYTDVIAKPVVRKPVTRETEVQADEEQAFLNRQLQLLNQGGGVGGPIGTGSVGSMGSVVGNAGGSLLKADGGGVAGGAGGQLRSPAGVQKTGDRRVSSGTPGVQSQLGSPKKIDGNKVGVPGSGEGVLANFFNSLLSKKTGSPIPKSPDLQAGSGVGLSGGSSSMHHHHLLSSTSSPLAAPDKASAMAMRSDAAAELDRLTRAAKKTSSPTSSPLPSLNQNSNSSGENHGNSSDC
ncbi:cytoplasmic dynein 1 light intermediate chain 2 isoform X1 [Ischnura elegans]|uniref:cytoplasmic dynein 1 light intermediate chain 2 isoform X1 n=1 Tax=Ischnura elegans TaxID=197161 RepID=UPI001ED8680F|nr:cytoplasmic dynein 1 light intermediate chain 2 isoform X1 [Ischnura elegans]